jgi:predicted enzyme related to lactoylglutathione lyase
MPNVVHLEIRVDVPHRAAKFYSSVFGWSVNKKEGPTELWAVAPEKNKPFNTNATLLKRSNRDAIIPRFDVPSIDAAIYKVVHSGGKVVSKKKFVPGVGVFSYCHDTEGNAFSILQKATGK